MSHLLHLADRPLFRLALRASGGSVTIHLNDVPVLHESTGPAFHADLPINEWLFQGTNTLTVRYQAHEAGFQPHHRATLQLDYRRLRAAHRSTATCGTLILDHSALPLFEIPEAYRHLYPPTTPAAEKEIEEDDFPLIALPGVPDDIHWQATEPRYHQATQTLTVGATFHLPPPWPQCPWRQATPQDTGAGGVYIIGRQTRTLWEILHRRDLAAYRQLMQPRSHALMAAYQLTEDELTRLLFIPTILADPAWELAPFPTAPLTVETAAGHRLLRATAPTGQPPPLALIHRARGVEALLEPWWMLADGVWQITR